MERRKGSVLIVEDDEQTNEIIQAVLSSEFEVLIAKNGLEALDFFDKQEPDFVITDWNMPQMNGFELVQALKQDSGRKHVPIIMMTGYMTEMDDLLAAYQAGVADFIRKPFDALELKARANSIFELASFYKKELQQKNRELIVNAMRLAEMNEFMLQIISKINLSVDPGNLALVEKIKLTLNAKILDSTWKQFNSYFLKIHPNFERELIQKHPDISPAELKLASLLRLNLNTKEISAILHLSPDGVKVSRSRLRKKLLLENETNLTGYLMLF